MQNKNLKIIQAMRQLVEVMQINLKNEIISKKSEMNISIEDDSLKKLLFLIDETLMNSFSDKIETVVKNIEK